MRELLNCKLYLRLHIAVRFIITVYCLVVAYYQLVKEKYPLRRGDFNTVADYGHCAAKKMDYYGFNCDIFSIA